MSATQIIQRIVSIQSNVKQHWMNKGALDASEVKKIDQAIEQIEKSPLIIDDCNNTSLSYLMAKIKQYAHSNQVKLVMVDYLQLVSASSGKSGNREQEVAKVARGLKNLAKELNISIMALSQLSRGVGMRSNSRPTLSDLRESGEIEQAADVVVLLYRPEYYGLYQNESGEATNGLAEIIFAKGRNIGVGTVNLKFIPDLTKFENYE
jgi:replicative DNA helicase